MTNRLGPLEIADVQVIVQSNDAALIAAGRECWTDLLAPPSACGETVVFDVVLHSDLRWEIRRDGELCESTADAGYVLFHLQWELNRIVLERRPITIHAAAVGVNGRAVVLCGSSMSGKTTLAGWLVAHGGEYVADEIVALDDRTRVLPYGRPLGVRHGGPLDALARSRPVADPRFQTYEYLLPVSALRPVGAGRSEPRAPLAIGAIVFPRFDPSGASGLTECRPSRALERLCANSPGLARSGAVVFRILAALVRSVPAFDVVSADLDQAGRLVQSLAGER